MYAEQVNMFLASKIYIGTTDEQINNRVDKINFCELNGGERKGA